MSNKSTHLNHANRRLSLVATEDGYFDLVVMCDHENHEHDGFRPQRLVAGKIDDNGEVSIFAGSDIEIQPRPEVFVLNPANKENND